MLSDAPDNVNDEDNGRRAAKRQRVSQACSLCRYAKLRCDGRQPTCTTCSQQEKRCTYETSFKRRGLRSGYVRALELLWGLTFRELKNGESVVDELLGRLSKQDLTASSDRTDAATPASVLLDRWKQSNVARHVDDLLDDNDEQHADCEEGGFEDERQQPRSDSEPYWMVVRNERLQLGQSHLGTAFPEAHSQASPSNAEHLQGISSNLKLPPYAPQLLQLFFHSGQSWLPILERHVTLKTAFQYSMDSSSLHHGDRSALWAVYAYASTALSHLLTDDDSRQHAQVHCGAFHAQAYSMLPLDSDQPVELGHIQCVALLALTHLSSGATRAAWRLMKIATQMLREMTEQQPSGTENEALAIAWLACFVLDTISSACQQAIPSLHYNDIVRYLQIDENGVEEWQLWQRPKTLQDQETFVETTTDVPTHSMGMLVLLVKLLRCLNGNLQHRSASWGPSGFGLEEWKQDLSSYLRRTGLTTALGNKDLNLVVLPPSFMVLSITYTTLVNRINRASNFSVHANDAALRGADYPLLSHATLQDLRKDDYFHKSFPVLNLLLTCLCVDDAERSFNMGGPNEPNYVSQLESGVNGLVPSSGLPQLGVQSDISARSMQEHSIQSSASLSANVGQIKDSLDEQGRGSEIPSLDGYMFFTDAPFLEFMDGLDDMSM